MEDELKIHKLRKFGLIYFYCTIYVLFIHLPIFVLKFRPEVFSGLNGEGLNGALNA